VIAWLATLFLFLLGLNLDFLRQIASGRLAGGGPLEAGIRLARGRAVLSPLESGAALDLVRGFDESFRWFLRRFMSILPDVDRFDLHEYVASGFDINPSRVLILDNLLPLIGYLVPCFILGYYLLRFREVANPN